MWFNLKSIHTHTNSQRGVWVAWFWSPHQQTQAVKLRVVAIYMSALERRTGVALIPDHDFEVPPGPESDGGGEYGLDPGCARRSVNNELPKVGRVGAGVSYF